MDATTLPRARKFESRVLDGERSDSRQRDLLTPARRPSAQLRRAPGLAGAGWAGKLILSGQSGPTCRHRIAAAPAATRVGAAPPSLGPPLRRRSGHRSGQRRSGRLARRLGRRRSGHRSARRSGHLARRSPRPARLARRSPRPAPLRTQYRYSR
ncbi:hypothetical protein GUJ93_ZPchr0014g46638 [Zizania palustris]|uniref:Uncharacterized protein n=1 Tax=Zizania palustris TaxID=103762 RepID=A0A8J5W0B0_ZIZPA|nr:hypothetical protein GUJ93_ZPchr0014g46638 [Zizania palustris]